jgi:transcriptional regulator with XRE-family HTH domain
MRRRHAALAAFGFNVRKRREKDGLSQAELAYMAELERSYICEIECGMRNPSLLNTIKLASALGTTVSGLCKGIEKQPPRV